MTDHLALDPGQRLPAEIRRVAGDLANRGLEHIRGAKEDTDTAVHEVRKRLKELRALVRIIRSEIGEQSYRIENRALRDAGRILSPTRDSAVLITTISELRTRPDARHVEEELERLQALFIQEHRAQIDLLRSHNRLEGVKECLHELQQRIAVWPIRRENFSALREGVGRVYNNGREAMMRGREKPLDPYLHEWRKQVKYLWYHIRMLAPAWPSVLNGATETLHELSDALGVDHDLAILADACRDRSSSGAGFSLSILPTIIRRRREEIRKEAWIQGARLYVEKPKAFTRRMEAYWRAGSKEF